MTMMVVAVADHGSAHAISRSGVLVFVSNSGEVKSKRSSEDNIGYCCYSSMSALFLREKA